MEGLHAYSKNDVRGERRNPGEERGEEAVQVVPESGLRVFAQKASHPDEEEDRQGERCDRESARRSCERRAPTPDDEPGENGRGERDSIGEVHGVARWSPAWLEPSEQRGHGEPDSQRDS
jgi:hypothetical protein